MNARRHTPRHQADTTSRVGHASAPPDGLRRDRGFSLIELLVALSCAAIIMTAAMTAIVYTLKESARSRAERDLVREGEFINLIMQRTLERAGTGVPSGPHLDGVSPALILPVAVAAADAVGVVGDFARPHAMYPTLGALHGRPGGDRSLIAYHTENNGTCVPNTGAPSCAIADASLFFPGDTTRLCNAVGQFDHRTCAWGLKRLQAGDNVQIVAGLGAWTSGTVDGTMAVSSAAPSAFMRLNPAYADPTAAWPNASGADGPSGLPGHNLVTTLDRVFFRYDAGNRRLERAQCWGSPEPAAAWWPPEAVLTLPSPLTAAPGICTPWESLASDVDAVAFSYFNATGVATAVKADVRRVDYRVQLSKTISGQTVRYVVVGSAPIWKGN